MVNDKKPGKPASPEDGRTRRPCRICGAWVRAGEGRVDVELRLLREVVKMGDGTLRELPGAGIGREPWTRWHDGCDIAPMEMVRRIVGDPDLSDGEAVSVARRAGVPLRAVEADREPATEPWGYLTADERKRIEDAHAAVLQLRGSGGLVRCNAGACGVCGIARSTAWHIESDMDALLRWRDRKPAPACSACWPLVERSRTREQLEAVAEGLLIGRRAGRVPVDWSSSGLKLYAEVAGDRHRGFAEPWSFSPGLDRVRERVWERWPETAPERVRLERELLARASLAERAIEAMRGEIAW